MTKTRSFLFLLCLFDKTGEFKIQGSLKNITGTTKNTNTIGRIAVKSGNLKIQEKKMKMSRISFLLLLLFLFVPSVNYAQSAAKPKLGLGTVSGIIKRNGGGCFAPETVETSDGYICVSVGKYLLELNTEGASSTVIGGGKSSLTKGKSVRVTYSNLQNSEMDLGRLFTGNAKRIVILSSNSGKRKK